MLATFLIFVSQIWLVAAVLDCMDREHFHLCGKFLDNAALGEADILEAGWLDRDERKTSRQKMMTSEMCREKQRGQCVTRLGRLWM